MFIETLVNIFVTVKQFMLFGIYLSFNIGKILVSTGISAFIVVFTLLQNFWTAFTILYEEFLYFINDLRIEIVTVFTTVQNVFNYIYTCSLFVSNYFNSVIINVNNFVLIIINSIQRATIIPKYLIFTLYEVLSNFGSGILFLFTLIPKCIQGGFDLIFEIGDTIQVEILTILINFITSVFTTILKVSFESILGLIVTLLLLTVGWKIRFILHPAVFQKLINIIKCVQMKILHRKLCNHCAKHVNGEQNVDMKKLEAQVHRLEEEKVCVVCQERGRSVLILPCRHFCMCDECAVRIVYGDGMCPVCRTRIRKFIENIFT